MPFVVAHKDVNSTIHLAVLGFCKNIKLQPKSPLFFAHTRLSAELTEVISADVYACFAYTKNNKY